MEKYSIILLQICNTIGNGLNSVNYFKITSFLHLCNTFELSLNPAYFGVHHQGIAVWEASQKRPHLCTDIHLDALRDL